MVRCFFPIDVETFDAKFEYKEQIRAQLRAMLKVPQHHSIVLTVGKLVPWKRQCDLVQFSNAVQLTRGDVTVVVVGSGPDEARLRAIASRIGPGGVLFAGFVQPRDLVDYYFAADVYCHCAEIEPHSLAISEAIYSGLPVVLSDRCGSYGATDDVQPRINGLVYQCGDQVGLAGALLRLLDEGRLRQEMSKVSAALGRKHQALAHCGGMRRAIEVLGLGG
jgi:glycosyltransferase involved in cell wall biosynthesis